MGWLDEKVMEKESQKFAKRERGRSTIMAGGIKRKWEVA